MTEQETVEKGGRRLDSLGPSGAMDVCRELAAALARHGRPNDLRSVFHLAGRCTDGEFAAMVARWRASKAQEPS